MSTFREDKIEKICMEMQIWEISPDELTAYYEQWLEKKKLANRELAATEINEIEVNETEIKKEDFPFEVLYSDGYKSKIFRSGVKAVAIMVSETLGVAMEDASGAIKWHEAIEYCENLTIANKKWRLPNEEELEILYRQKEEITKILEYFGKKALKNSWYWSSTEDDYSAWIMRFSDGNRGFNSKKFNYYYVRPVLA